MIEWHKNQNWKELDKPEVGDKVMLEFKDTFEYCVKAVVTEVNNDEFTGQGIAVFNGNAEETYGEAVDSLKGKLIRFNRINIQKVFKKPLA